VTITAAQITAINTKAAEAVAAIEAADYAVAIAKLLGVKVMISTLPSRSAKDGAELEYTPETLDALIADCRKQQAGAAGLRQTKVSWQRPTS